MQARRTQTERREETKRKLIAATIEAMLKVGYARLTVQEICGRAKLSHGALFRFYPKLLDLVIAAAEETANRQIAQFDKIFTHLSDSSVGGALEALREVCRAPNQVVYQELAVAARTDKALKKALKPAFARHMQTTREAARRVKGVEHLPLELIDAVLFPLIYAFEGESLSRNILPQPEVEAQRFALIKAGLQLFLQNLGGSS